MSSREAGDAEEIAAKKPKLSSSDSTKNGFAIKSTFEGFEVTKILQDQVKNKCVFIQGKFRDKEDQAVVILEKKPFPTTGKTLSEMLSSETSLCNILQNDIYGSYEAFPPAQTNGLKVSLIYPATEKHIQKYTSQDMFLVEETADDYKNITLPYLKATRFSIQWVFNILEKRTESERIVFEDADPINGFILIPDMKWDGVQMDNLYLVAICHVHDVLSLRDLNESHLPLLRGILEKGRNAIKEKYGVSSSKLRVYLHYQPSYYHLHVHFTHVKFDAPGSGVERAHLLSDVINNIEIDNAYYQKMTLSYILKENDDLLRKFKEAGRILD